MLMAMRKPDRYEGGFKYFKGLASLASLASLLTVSPAWNPSDLKMVAQVQSSPFPCHVECTEPSYGHMRPDV